MCKLCTMTNHCAVDRYTLFCLEEKKEREMEEAASGVQPFFDGHKTLEHLCQKRSCSVKKKPNKKPKTNPRCISVRNIVHSR